MKNVTSILNILLTTAILFFQRYDANAQSTFATVQTNPFGLTPIESATPAFVDLDGDGDFDLMCGESEGNYLYFQNTGTAGAPAFAPAQTNPFGLEEIGFSSSPAFADLDGDGDMDMMSGESQGKFFFYYKNTGTTTAPAFAGSKKNQFGLSDIGDAPKPAFADLDGDGDMDMMVGEATGSFFYFQNTGTPASPVFTVAEKNPFGLKNVGVDVYNIGGNTTAAFADLDKDGDLDLMSGKGNGTFFYFQNAGTVVSPAFVAPKINPFGLTSVVGRPTPAFADLDADGDIDMISGQDPATFNYFENTLVNACHDNGRVVSADADGDQFGDPAHSQFVANCIVPAGYVANSTDCNDDDASIHPGRVELANGTDDDCNGIIDDVATQFALVQTNPFGLIQNGFVNTPVFADLDNDGDVDMMTGDGTGSFFYFQNYGTASAPAFANALINPFGLTVIGNSSAPAFADLDGDGDMDMISGAGYPSPDLFYFQNTGTASVPSFGAAQTNPFGLTSTYYWSTPAFADLDGDGDWDLLAGTDAAGFHYFKNIGSATSPAFAPDQGNPFGIGTGMNYSYNMTPAFGDLNGDGIQDLITGVYTGIFFYFQNIGTAADPAFLTAQENPFGLTDIGTSGAPAFTDLDGDGDLDLMTGERNGNFLYFQNITFCNGLTVYTDGDGDSYGDVNNNLFVGNCIIPNGYVANSTDCNDANIDIHPGTMELCSNGIDDNCDGAIDEGCGETCDVPTGLTTGKVTGATAKLKWEAVADADGYKVRYKATNTKEWKHGTTSGASKQINGLLANTSYEWEVKTYCQITPNVMSGWSSSQTFTTGSLRIGDESLQHVSFSIYPNPAEDHATIQFTLQHSSHVYIKVYDVSGKETGTLLNAELQQGEQSFQINTGHFSKGVYMVKMISDSGIENQKLIVQ